MITYQEFSEALVDPFFFGFFLTAAAVFGALFGSFFNVCIYRIPKGVPLAFPGSHCYQCGQPIQWYDNIPLLSYWVLGGQCRYCGARFSIRYFLVELLTSVLFAGIYIRFCNPQTGYSLAVFPGVVFASLLIVETFTDLDHWIIPDRISLGGAVAGLGLALIFPLGLAPHNPLAEPLPFLDVPPNFVPAVNSLFGAALGYAMLAAVGFIGTLVFRKEAMGQGDWKLFAMIGAFVGPINTPFIFALACFVGLLITFVLYLAGRLWTPGPQEAAVADLRPDPLRMERLIDERELTPTERLVVTKALIEPGRLGSTRHHLPFGPYLAIAALIVYLGWEPIRQGYEQWVLFPAF